MIENYKPLTNPVFIFSSIRSGSTLLRCILNSHSHIYSPHELHFRYLNIISENEYLHQALKFLDLNTKELKMVLWDSIYYYLLKMSKKKMIIDKSPSNLWAWEEINKFWTNAKYIFLKRDPATIVRSILCTNDGRNLEEAVDLIFKVVKTMEIAQLTLNKSIVVSYEDFTTYPKSIFKKICDFLNVEYESNMLDYGSKEHGPLEYGIGDWSSKIKSGKILKMKTERISPKLNSKLLYACKIWEYPIF